MSTSGQLTCPPQAREIPDVLRPRFLILFSVDSYSERAERRIEKSLESLATFARIGEELVAMRATTAAGVAMERLEKMIQLNRETHAVVKRSLLIAEGDLARQKPGADSDSPL